MSRSGRPLASASTAPDDPAARHDLRRRAARDVHSAPFRDPVLPPCREGRGAFAVASFRTDALEARSPAWRSLFDRHCMGLSIGGAPRRANRRTPRFAQCSPPTRPTERAPPTSRPSVRRDRRNRGSGIGKRPPDPRNGWALAASRAQAARPPLRQGVPGRRSPEEPVGAAAAARVVVAPVAPEAAGSDAAHDRTRARRSPEEHAFCPAWNGSSVTSTAIRRLVDPPSKVAPSRVSVRAKVSISSSSPSTMAPSRSSDSTRSGRTSENATLPAERGSAGRPAPGRPGATRRGRPAGGRMRGRATARPPRDREALGRRGLRRWVRAAERRHHQLRGIRPAIRVRDGLGEDIAPERPPKPRWAVASTRGPQLRAPSPERIRSP